MSESSYLGATPLRSSVTRSLCSSCESGESSSSSVRNYDSVLMPSGFSFASAPLLACLEAAAMLEMGFYLETSSLVLPLSTYILLPSLSSLSLPSLPLSNFSSSCSSSPPSSSAKSYCSSSSSSGS